MAAAVAVKVGRWAMFESLWLALAVGFSIRATGMLFTLGIVLWGLVLLVRLERDSPGFARVGHCRRTQTA